MSAENYKQLPCEITGQQDVDKPNLVKVCVRDGIGMEDFGGFFHQEERQLYLFARYPESMDAKPVRLLLARLEIGCITPIARISPEEIKLDSGPTISTRCIGAGEEVSHLQFDSSKDALRITTHLGTKEEDIGKIFVDIEAITLFEWADHQLDCGLFDSL